MNRSKTVVFIWIFYTLLSTLSSKWLFGTPTPHMGRDLAEHGPVFLKHGDPTSQYLSLSDIFTIRDGFVTPVLKAVNPHVHANVLKALKPILDPYFDEAIWFQNSSLYHFSMFHASHHISPIPATPNEIEAEAAAVRNIAKGLCPLKIVLDMVVLTLTGVLLGKATSRNKHPLAKARNKHPHAKARNKWRLSSARTHAIPLQGPSSNQAESKNKSKSKSRNITHVNQLRKLHLQSFSFEKSFLAYHLYIEE
ncbi:unnamed protein product [Malus baccata var. baccata]